MAFYYSPSPSIQAAAGQSPLPSTCEMKGNAAQSAAFFSSKNNASIMPSCPSSQLPMEFVLSPLVSQEKPPCDPQEVPGGANTS